MSKLVLRDFGSDYQSKQALNANNTTIETAFENTLSRDGTSPNFMQAPLDMNSNQIINLEAGTSGSNAVTVSQLNAAIAALNTIVSPSSTLGTLFKTGEEFGAVGNGTTDDSTAFQNAINYLANLGGGVIQAGAKTYALGTALIMKPGVQVWGLGRGISVFKVKGPIQAFTIADETEKGGTVGLKDLTVWGYLDRSGAAVSLKLCQLDGFDFIYYDNVEAKWSPNMSLTGRGKQAVARGCYIHHSCRDGINLTGSVRIVAVDNFCDMVGDDAIALHIQDNVNPANVYIVVQGNNISKSFGIKCLGIRNGSISNNNLRFYYGHGVHISHDGTEGAIARANVTVSNNSFVDYIDPTIVGYAGGEKAGSVVLYGPAQNGLLTYPIETYKASGTFQSPAPYINIASSTGAIGPSYNVVIANNTSTNTLEGLTHFSDAGFGLLWSGLVETDAVLSTTLFVNHQIRLDDDLENVLCMGNTAYGCGTQFYMNPLVGQIFRNINLVYNSAMRTSYGAIIDHLGAACYLDVNIEHNDWNLDPLMESVDRTHPLDGTWTSTTSTSCVAVSAAYAVGLRVRNNTIRNVGQVLKINGTTVVDYSDNNLFWDWSGATAKGIGNTNDKTTQRNYFQYSDPTSVNFLKYTAGGDSAFVRNATSIPSSGYYITGQIVWKSNPSVSTHTCVIGWLRLTDGNSHTTEVDWAAMKVTTN